MSPGALTVDVGAVHWTAGLNSVNAGQHTGLRLLLQDIMQDAGLIHGEVGMSQYAAEAR